MRKIFHFLILIFISFILIEGCKKNNESSDYSIKERIEISKNIIYKAEEIINDSINTAILNKEVVNLDLIVSQISKFENVVEVELNPNNTCILIKKIDGYWLNIPLIEKNDEQLFESNLKKTTKSNYLSIGKSSSFKLKTTNKKAIILAPFQNVFNENLDNIANILINDGFAVEKYENNDADLDKFRGDFLSQFDIIYISSHGDCYADTRVGNPYADVKTSEKINESRDNSLSEEEYNYLVDSKGYYAITSRWLKLTGASFKEGSFIFINSCGSDWNKTTDWGFSKPLIEYGIDGFTGWDNTIQADLSNMTAQKLFDLLCHGYSLKNATEAIKNDPEIKNYSFIVSIWPILSSQYDVLQTIDINLLDYHQEKTDEFFIVNENIETGTLYDSRDSKTYRTVKIGNQWWMSENLNFDMNGSHCYEDTLSNCNIFGKLYEFDAASDACPVGWHLPSKDEWFELFANLGLESEIPNCIEIMCFINSHAESLFENGSSGLNIQLGGNGYYNDLSNTPDSLMFTGIDSRSRYWTSTKDYYNSTEIIITFQFQSSQVAEFFTYIPYDLCAIRCIKD